MQSEWHVLDFLCDEDGSCALTVFLDDTRYHIIADSDKLDGDTAAGAEYLELVQDFQQPATEGHDPRPQDQYNDASSDSGAVLSDRYERSDDEEAETIDPETALQRWLVAPLLQTIETRSEDDISTLTIQQWYSCSTHFYDLKVSEDDEAPQAIELESNDDLEERMRKLLPSATLPKYITEKVDAPFWNASDFNVLACSDQPPGTPYHPCKVEHRKTKQTYFVKIVDNQQPVAAKREIDILQSIKALGLDKQFNVPAVEGLIVFDDASETAVGQKRAMGFLLTEIEDPTPLTLMLRSGVSQKKREKWAEEVQNVKDLLHENGIVWGDAKADNFMVDAGEKLWIIDFGGGYTEGWVDAELNETVEGDDLGTTKIVNALKDPFNNVRYEDEEQEPGSVTQDDQPSRKRRRHDDIANVKTSSPERQAKAARR